MKNLYQVWWGSYVVRRLYSEKVWRFKFMFITLWIQTRIARKRY